MKLWCRAIKDSKNAFCESCILEVDRDAFFKLTELSSGSLDSDYWCSVKDYKILAGKVIKQATSCINSRYEKFCYFSSLQKVKILTNAEITIVLL
jgi:hypothetical protein